MNFGMSSSLISAMAESELALVTLPPTITSGLRIWNTWSRREEGAYATRHTYPPGHSNKDLVHITVLASG